MSAFAVIYEQTNTPVNPVVFNKVMERLSHRGSDGHDSISKSNITLGHWHFWTTPEEVGERQPLELNGLPFRIVLDGRIDNREELFSKLQIKSAEGKSLSDAALILYAYACWGEHCFEYFVGEFALVIFDEQRNEIICARDHLGDRTLFYAVQGSQIVIASEPWAVAGATATKPEINETAAAHYFALKATSDGQTLFKNVYELLPAHAMIVTAAGIRQSRYWRPDPSIRLRGLSDKEYAEQFLSLLDESVRCRLRSTTPVGVLMSGGLDSGSVACLAARMLAPTPLTTISYVFDELTDCDERQYIDAIKERWGIRSIQIPCDDAWPYKDWDNWKPNPNDPAVNPYRLLHNRTYKRANDEGLRVLLTGSFGDHLYIAGREWLADLIVEGRLLSAWRELSFQIQNKGLRQTLTTIYVRRVVRRFLDGIPGWQHLLRKQYAPDWLTQFSADFLLLDKDRFDPAIERYATLLGLLTAYSCSHAFFNVSHYGLELRSPYRDRRLIEFVLSLPAYQLYSRGHHKHILRTAMQDILPESIRTRHKLTSMISLFFRGVEREKNVLQFYIQNPDAIWRKFVKADWLLNRWNVVIAPEQDGREALVAWLCISYEAWHKSVFSSS